MYALYASYGYDSQNIAKLFIVGFGTSLLVGPFVGKCADVYGRKNAVFMYATLYVFSCITKHFDDYYILLFGRVLGGTATSLLASVFESWLIAEHSGSDGELKGTFRKSMVANSVAAVTSGVLGSLVVTSNTYKWGTHFYYGGYTGPFDLAIIFLLIGVYLTNRYWGENYGMRSVHSSVRFNTDIVLLGFIQSLFEAAMYCFIFVWTPVLGENINHGLVFSTFMIACTVGSYINMPLGVALVLSSLSLLISSYGHEQVVNYICFLVFEFCVGVYFPQMGMMKSERVPEETRATMYNIFRIPLNFIVVLVLVTDLSLQDILFFSSSMIFVAFGLLNVYINK